MNVDIKTTKPLRVELAKRGNVDSGLLALVIKHLIHQGKSKQPDLIVEHQQQGEPLPFAVSASSDLYPNIVLIATYQEAVEEGFYDTDGEIKH